MRMYPHQSTEKWNVYNGNLLDREASRELTMLYKRRMEEGGRGSLFLIGLTSAPQGLTL